MSRITCLRIVAVASLFVVAILVFAIGGAEHDSRPLRVIIAKEGEQASSQASEPVTQDAGARLHITVTDGATAARLSGAACAVVGADGTEITTVSTGIDGIASISPLRRGHKYDVRVTRPPYVAVTRAVTITAALVASDVPLFGRGTLRGTVRDETGAPVPSVQIFINGHRGASWATGGDGRFLITQVGAGGKSRVEFAALRYEPCVIVCDLPTEDELTVTLQRVVPLQVRLAFPGLAGRMREGQMIQLDGLIRADDRVLYGGTINVARPVFVYTAAYMGEERVVVSLACAGGSRVHAEAPIARDSDGYVADATIPDCGLATVLVVTADGAPVSGEDVLCLAVPDGSDKRVMRTDRDGLGQLLVGTDGAALRFWCHRGASDAIRIDSQAQPHRVVLEDTNGTVVVDTAGEAVNTATFELEDRVLGRAGFRAHENGDGTFAFRVPAGEYRLLWRDTPISGFEIRVVAGEIVTYHLPTACCGIVGAAPDASSVTIWKLVEDAQRPIAELDRSASGAFGISGLVPGAYLVDAHFDENGARVVRQVEVLAGQVADAGRLSADGILWSSFHLERPDGAALAGAKVTLRGLPSRGHLLTTVVTDGQGNARASLGDPSWILLWTDDANALFRAQPATRNYRVTCPDTKGSVRLDAPRDRGTPADVMWVSPRPDGITWFIMLGRVADGAFSLPRCDGLQYFLATYDEGNMCYAARVSAGVAQVLHNRRVVVPRYGLPAEAAFCEVAYERLGEADLRAVTQGYGPFSLSRGDLEIDIPEGAHYRIRLRSERRDRVWEAVVDHDSTVLSFGH